MQLAFRGRGFVLLSILLIWQLALSSCVLEDRESKLKKEAELCLARGWYNKASDLYLQALKLNPRSASMLAGRAEALSRLGKESEALDSAKLAVDLEPKNWQLHFTLGKIYCASSFQEKGIECFDEALALSAAKVEIYLERAAANLALEKYRRTLEDCDLALRLLIRKEERAKASFRNERTVARIESNTNESKKYELLNESRAYLLRASAYMGLDLHREAFEDFDQALALSENDTAILCARASAESLLGRHEKAIADFNSCLQKDQSLFRAYLGLGSTYMAMKEYDKAVEALSKGIRAFPQFEAALLSRGIAYLNLGKKSEALVDFEAAMRLNKADERPYLYAGICKLLMERSLSASGDFESYIGKSAWKKNAGLVVSLLQISYRLAGKDSEARLALSLSEGHILPESWDLRVVAYLFGKLDKEKFFDQLSRRSPAELKWTYLVLGLDTFCRDQADPKTQRLGARRTQQRQCSVYLKKSLGIKSKTAGEIDQLLDLLAIMYLQKQKQS